MHPRETAAQESEKRAIVLEPSGAAVTSGELAERSRSSCAAVQFAGIARWGRHRGLHGESSALFRALLGGPQRRPLLHAHQQQASCERVAYIVRDCERVFCSCPGRSPKSRQSCPATSLAGLRCYMMDGTIGRFASYETAIAAMPDAALRR